jgi:large subunit ribosomal protein L25
MVEVTNFKAEPRTRGGKGAIRAVRAQGQVPGVIYGGNEPPELITLQVPELTKEHLTGKMLSRVCFVELGGKKTRAVPREVQVDPVRDRPIHVDFLRLPKGARVSLMIPVEFKHADASPGIKRGGVLNVVRHEVELIVDAENIPDHLEVSLDGLDINDSVHISAVMLPPGCKPKIKRDFTVATIAPSSGYAAEAKEAAEKAAEAAALAAAMPEGVEGAEGAPAAAAGAALGDAKEAAPAKEAKAKDKK